MTEADVGQLPQQPRTYMITSGRTRPVHQLRLESQLQPGPTSPVPGSLSVEAMQALLLCEQRSVSVAEIAAGIGRSVGVTRLLVDSLLDAGVLAAPQPWEAPTDVDVLRRLVERLRCLV